MSLNKEAEKIKAVLIIEVIGKPPEHLTETLEDLTKKIGEEEDVKVIEKKIKEPKPMEERKDFYSNFAEVEVEVKDAMVLAILMFKYMPAHIEVLSPEKISISNNDYGDLLSELVRRLHKYDELARIFMMEKSQMQKKIEELEGKNKKD